MVACINILYWGNWSALADGSAVSCFLRISDRLESICKFFFSLKIFTSGTFLRIDSKWSETRKKTRNRQPDHCRRPIFSVKYVDTSYHTTLHQNISINVACMQYAQKSIGPVKVVKCPPPLYRKYVIKCHLNVTYKEFNTSHPYFRLVVHSKNEIWKAITSYVLTLFSQ